MKRKVFVEKNLIHGKLCAQIYNDKYVDNTIKIYSNHDDYSITTQYVEQADQDNKTNTLKVLLRYNHEGIKYTINVFADLNYLEKPYIEYYNDYGRSCYFREDVEYMNILKTLSSSSCTSFTDAYTKELLRYAIKALTVEDGNECKILDSKPQFIDEIIEIANNVDEYRK